MTSPLQNHVLFTSNDIDEAEYIVGSVFCSHKLTPAKTVKRINARMCHARVSEYSSLNFLEYGSEVTVEPGPLKNFFNVQVQLSGSVATRCGSQNELVATGEAAVLSPSEYVSMKWARNSSMLIFCIDRKMVERKLKALLGNHLPEPVVFDAKLTPNTIAGAGWLRAIRFLQNELDNPEGFFNHPQAINGFEEDLVLSLLYGQPHNYTPLLNNKVSTIAPVHVKRVENYILANAGNAITIEELTRISQVSARSLFAGFRHFRGISPMRYLRIVRLENARHELQQAESGASVTDVAGRWGFVQLGRFASNYQERFGELPSATLRRSE